MLKHFALTIGFLLVSLTQILAQTPLIPVFHPAQSPAEKRLEATLHEVENEAVLDCIIGKTACATPRNFSVTFLAAIRRTEAALVKKDCKGHYQPGEVCGFDVNPVTCTQDVSGEGYVFQTQAVEGGFTTIGAAWPHDIHKDNMATYRLIKKRGSWQIDGLECRNSMKFNMEPPPMPAQVLQPLPAGPEPTLISVP